MTWGRRFAALGAALAFLAVAAGAFGAHLLEGRLPSDLVEVFETAAQYQMYHAVGMLIVGVMMARHPSSALWWAGACFLAGTVIFSGSLYLLALSGVRWLGAITPIGGICFLVGWAALLWGVVRAADSPNVQESAG